MAPIWKSSNRNLPAVHTKSCREDGLVFPAKIRFHTVLRDNRPNFADVEFLFLQILFLNFLVFLPKILCSE
jgi:hypothetical protein